MRWPGRRYAHPMLCDRFRAAVEAGEAAGTAELFHEDAIFRSPVVYRPYAGRVTGS